MGNSQAITYIDNKNKQVFTNKSFVEVLNKSVNNSMATSLVSNNSQCSSSNTINQTIDFSKCVIKGDLNLGKAKQEAKILVNFSCLNQLDAGQQMAQELMTALMNNLESEIGTAALNKMDNEAKTSASTSGIGGGDSDSLSITKNSFELTSNIETHKNIQNVVENNINAFFQVENIQSCFANSAIDQNLNFHACEVGGNVNMDDFTQSSDINAVAKCINKSNIVQEVIAKSFQDMGVRVKDDAKVTSTNDMVNVISNIASSVGIGGVDSANSSGSSFAFSLCLISGAIAAFVIKEGLL